MDKSKSNQTELTYKCGIGVASVNVYTGRMKFEVPIFSIGANSFQIATSLIYNFHLRNNDFGNRKIGLGNGWKINIQQYVFPYHKDYCIEEFATGDYVYIDSNCSIHRFVKYKEKKIGNETINVYYDTLGNGLRLQVGKQYGIEIYDSHHNILKFNSDGKIIEIVSGVHPDIKKKIEYDINGNLISIYDIRKKTRSINFVYNDKQELTTISINNTKFTQNLTYQSGKFIKLSKQSDTNIKDVMYFRCVENEEGNLKEVIDADSLEALIFAYVFDAKIPDERLYKIIIGAATRKIITDSLDADTFSGEDKYFSHNQYIKNHSKKVKDYELKISYTKNSIDYTYEKNYTDCRNEKGITTRYYFNLKGQTISAFDVNGQYYYSLYKPQGWRLFNGGHGDVLIDGEQSIKINSDTCILQAKNENSFAKVFGGENNKYKFTENFELSFWAKCSHDIENDIKIWVMYDGAYGITCETILDKTYKDTWQYVTIPIKLGEKKFLDKQYCIYIYGLPSGHTLEIADVTIKQDVGSIIKIFDENKEFTFSKQREKLSTEDKYVRKLSIVYNINGEEFDNYITSHFFMTDSDVYQTYKNIFNKQNPNDSFDLIYCNGTKVIEVDNVKIRMNATQLTNIEDIEFKVDKGIPNYYSVSADRIENSTYHISEIIHSFHYDSNTNQTYYGTNTFEELTTHLMRIDDWRELKQLALYNENGICKEKKDGYGVITKYNYDTYGNLDSIRIYNEENSSNYLETKYMYNGIEDRLREAPITIKQNDIEQTFTYNDPFMTLDSVNIGDYKQKLKYDNFEEKIVSIENIGANNNSDPDNYDIIKNEIEFDDYGRIKSCKDSNNNAYGIVYNVFSEPAQYYYNGKLKASTVLRRYDSEDIYKETKYNARQNVTTTNLDKYGRITSQNNGDYQIQYTYSDDGKLEGPYASYIKKVIDPYEGKEYTYNYDNETQKGTLSNGKLTIVNDSNADIKYDFTENSYYIVNMITMENSNGEDNKRMYPKLVEPRLKRTKYTKYDKNNDNKVIDEYKEFNFTYKFDDLGRFAGKTGEVYENKINADKDITYTIGTSNIEKINYTIHSDKEDVCFSYQNPKYDNKGNIIKVIEAGKRYKENPTKDGKRAIVDLLNREYTYTYDGLNRLDTEKRNTSDNISINEYVYDNTNMLSAVKKDGIEIKKFKNENEQLKEVTIKEKLESRILHSEVSSIATNTYAIQYDDYGNTKKIVNKDTNNNYGNMIIEYDNRNLASKFSYYDYFIDLSFSESLWVLISCNQECYYNYQGKRYRRKVGFHYNDRDVVYKDVYYYFDGDRIIGEDWLDENGTLKEEIRYFYDAEGISGMSYKGHNFNLIKDSLGNISKVMYQGKMIGEYVYDAWGNCEVIELSIDGEKDAGERDRFVLYNNPFRYKGYYCDIETGLFWLSSRYYSPEFGRFLQVSDISELNPHSINGLNLYAYANNNPISFSYNSSSAIGSTSVGGGLVSSIGAGSSFTGNRNTNSTAKGGLNLGWIANKLDAGSTLHGLYSYASTIYNNISYFSKNLHAFSDDMTMLGASMKDGVLAFNQFSWGLGKSDVFGIALGVGLDIYDSIQRGVSPGGVVLGATLTTAKGVGLVYLNKGILYGATALGSAICPGVGTVVGFVVGGVVCVFVDIFVSNWLDELIDSIAK